jgi:hypothetical protein
MQFPAGWGGLGGPEQDRRGPRSQGMRQEISAREARQGVTPHVVRWVLRISTGLAAVALALAWYFSS